MNDVVERVARAIAAEMNRSGPIASKAVACAAIEAMREPTDEMVVAGSRSRPYREDDGDYDGHEHRDNTLGTWESMIDAALADASPDIGKEGIGNDG